MTFSVYNFIESIKYTENYPIGDVFTFKTTSIFDRKKLISEISAGALRSAAEVLPEKFEISAKGKTWMYPHQNVEGLLSHY
jgi:hypothetical protein